MKKPASIVVLIAAVLTAALFMPLSKRLCVTESDSGVIVKVFDRDTDSFVISYTHSVNLGRVRDYYSVADNGALRLDRTAFVSYGAGMPEPYGNQVFRVTGDAIEISGINLELNELLLQTGVTADHHIEANGKTTVLNDMVPSQTRVVAGVRRLSCYTILQESLRCRPGSP